MERRTNKNNGYKDKDRRTVSPVRRKRQRRMKKSRGYAYISMVGWVDRREKIRRENDTFSE